jgi:hypothetical protein
MYNLVKIIKIMYININCGNNSKKRKEGIVYDRTDFGSVRSGQYGL